MSCVESPSATRQASDLDVMPVSNQNVQHAVYEVLGVAATEAPAPTPLPRAAAHSADQLLDSLYTQYQQAVVLPQIARNPDWGDLPPLQASRTGPDSRPLQPDTTGTLTEFFQGAQALEDAFGPLDTKSEALTRNASQDILQLFAPPELQSNRVVAHPPELVRREHQVLSIDSPLSVKGAMNTPHSGDGEPLLNNESNMSKRPSEAIREIEDLIRREPTVSSHRWALFQWLCVDRQWKRALQQLQVHARMAPEQGNLVQAYRDLVRAENWRERTLAGLMPPGQVLDTPVPWMRDLYAALEAAAGGQVDQADALRERALDQAPMVKGHGAADFTFDWMSDSDSRLGPVFELMVAAGYRWLSLADIDHWRLTPPKTLSDLVWAPCEVTLIDGTPLRGFTPARYPEDSALSGSVAQSSDPQPGQHANQSETPREALLLGRQTSWREVGRTGVIASGRKTWMTSEGERNLFELADCTFEP